jgi:glucoamylase
MSGGVDVFASNTARDEIRPGASRLRFARRCLTAVTVLLAILVTALPASASWSPGGLGHGTGAARAVGLPTSTAASATSSSTVQITWAAPSAPSAPPSQYVVRRTAPSTATVCTVPATTFTCNDTGLSASTTYTYTVEARAGNWSSGQTAGFSATTPAPPTFKVAAAAGNKTAGTAFTVTLTATTNGVTTDTTYTGAHAITFSGPANSPDGTAPTYPATVTFAAGVGTATITLVDAQPATLGATDGTRSGSTSVTVIAAAAFQLGYTSSSVSCASGTVTVGNGGSFTSNVSTFDTYGNVATSASARTVNMSRTPNQGTLAPTTLTIPANLSETSASFTYTLPAGPAASVTVKAKSPGMTEADCIVKAS